jgi:hypothetical protein
MNIGYINNADGTTAVVTDKDGIVLGSAFKGICYGSILSSDYSPIPKLLEKEEAMFLDVYYQDSLSKHYKEDNTVTLKFLKALESTGLFKNTTVSLIETKLAPSQVKHYRLNSNYTLHIRHNIDKASAQEMFLIGLSIRTAANQPQIVDDYVKLLELEPEVDKWKLFIIAHCMHINAERTETSGHRLASRYFGK